MSYLLETIAADLKAARKAKGLSQAELGQKVGLPQSHISKIEQGKVNLTVESLMEIGRVLGLEVMLIPGDTRLEIKKIALRISKDHRPKSHQKAPLPLWASDNHPSGKSFSIQNNWTDVTAVPDYLILDEEDE